MSSVTRKNPGMLCNYTSEPGPCWGEVEFVGETMAVDYSDSWPSYGCQGHSQIWDQGTYWVNPEPRPEKPIWVGDCACGRKGMGVKRDSRGRFSFRHRHNWKIEPEPSHTARLMLIMGRGRVRCYSMGRHCPQNVRQA